MPTSLRRRLLDPRDEGFTLVELIVAMFVIAIVLLSILFVQANALTTNAQSDQRQQATSHANAAMEQMRALPWDVLTRGLSSNFVGASGGDPFVTGASVKLGDPADAATPVYALRVSGTQLGDDETAWPPLFDTSGSNLTQVQDIAGRGTVFDVRAYVLDADPADASGGSNGLGIAVIVSYEGLDSGKTEYTALVSTAYKPNGGCGNTAESPFLASCEARFDATSKSGGIVTRIDASELVTVGPDDELGLGPATEVLPSSGLWTAESRAVTTGARLASQQYSVVDTYTWHGGLTWDDDDDDTVPADEGWTTGQGTAKLQASDNFALAEVAEDPADTTSVTGGGTQTFSGLGWMTLSMRADDGTTGTLRATSARSCPVFVNSSSIPATQTCGVSSAGGASDRPVSTLSVSGNAITLSKVSSGSSPSSDAWVGRFSEAIVGNTDTRCFAVANAGCASAGSRMGFSQATFGQSSSWEDSDAADGLVEISNYAEILVADRGSLQLTDVWTATRAAQIRIWNGTDYTTIVVDADTNGTWSAPAVTFETSNAVVTATAELLVSPTTSQTTGASPCKTEACAVSLTSGLITVDVELQVEPKAADADPFQISSSTTIGSGVASVSYKEPEDV
ncbi:prepilin-type N-terminal cleavage/methylation domain-containing protein [Demequina gelatinilytica]|uniref:prepilin-type N-terminal cleavage/methylation domain-containing protein n=1 Tax=Demequina gelatinilytica TaxID=1638980 RepID=UPI000781D45F|nr:prepilin-type N-terminal cleavage/methylation domain-containing protein [Demequina gelatinilytica]